MLVCEPSPEPLVINADLAELLALAHDDDGAIQQSHKTIELDPAFGLAHNHLGQAFLQKRGLHRDQKDYVTVALSLLPILLNALLISLATTPIPNVAARAIRAASSAYSIKS